MIIILSILSNLWNKFGGLSKILLLLKETIVKDDKYFGMHLIYSSLSIISVSLIIPLYTIIFFIKK